MNNNSKNNGTRLPAQQQTFVLVHGAWQAPYAWDRVKEDLLREGYQVVTVQLPGHGADTTDPESLHMESYITYVSDEVAKIGGKVILAGHSMAGMIISGVAEQLPDLIDKLVYIAAYVPVSGQSAYALSLLDQQSLLGASLSMSEDQSEFDIKKEDITNIFCQDASDSVKQLVLDNYRLEPAAPFSDPVVLTDANFGKVVKYYVETLLDHGIGNGLQKEMIATAGITNVYEMNTGHTPALSNPAQLSEILNKIAQH
jgi:pimeloyl-ACP methyl ester carboxylesterase